MLFTVGMLLATDKWTGSIASVVLLIYAVPYHFQLCSLKINTKPYDANMSLAIPHGYSSQSLCRNSDMHGVCVCTKCEVVMKGYTATMSNVERVNQQVVLCHRRRRHLASQFHILNYA